jgi:hypothetical protein
MVLTDSSLLTTREEEAGREARLGTQRPAVLFQI